MAKRREKLELSCTGSDCGNSLHCYRPTTKMKKLGQAGACRTCGAEVVDWERVRELNPKDIPYLVTALKTEFIRAKMTAMKPNQWAWNYARRKGRKKLLSDLPDFLRKHIGPPRDAFDGRRVPWPQRTPQRMNPYFYGQHATGTCCRTCLETWYGIPQDRKLSPKEIIFFTAVLTDYISRAFPGLPDDGQVVPVLRKQ
jgi:hypothetical protein